MICIIIFITGLQQTKLGQYIENRVNSFLKKKESGAGEVTVRVVSSSEKFVEVKPGMKARYEFSLVFSIKVECKLKEIRLLLGYFNKCCKIK